jgi:predicted dehydrogenase
MVRVAVVGTGSIGMRHLRILHALQDVAVVAVPARPERVEALRAEGFDAVASVDEAFERPLGGALIATDSGRHERDAIGALAAGCHVLVEKPLAPTRAGCVRILDAARAAQRRVHVACNLRFDDGLRWVHARLPSIGTLRLADAECLSWLPSWRTDRPPTEGYAARPGEGGVLLDLIHEIDYAGWLLGPARRVMARLENSGVLGLPDAVEETALAIVEHAEVALTLRLSYVVQPTSRKLRLFGAKGALEWDLVSRSARRCDVDGRELEAFTWRGPMPMYEAQARAWVGSLSGAADGLVDGDEATRAVSVCDAMRVSSAHGRAVDVIV